MTHNPGLPPLDPNTPLPVQSVIFRTSCRLWPLVLLALCLSLQGASPPALDALTENTKTNWFKGALSGATTVADDKSRFKIGSASVKFSATGGGDAWMGTPAAKTAGWNLEAAGIHSLNFWLYADNKNTYLFQNSSPWIQLHTTATSYFELHATSEVMNNSLTSWQRFTVPFEGNATWALSVVGTPTLTNINWLEFHADTWGTGFGFGLDGLEFSTAAVTALRCELSSLRLWTGYHWVNNALVATIDQAEVGVLNSKATWLSSNPAVVSVDANGALEAFAAGTVTLTATYSGKSATQTVEVLNAALPPVHETVSAELATPAANALLEVPVLILRFLPTLDGTNIDVAQARDYWSPGDITLTAMKQKLALIDRRMKFMIEEASRYHGYKDPQAKPSLGVRVVDCITVYEQLPPGATRRSMASGAKLYEADYPRVFDRFNVAHYVNDLGVKEIWLWAGSVDSDLPSYDPATCRPEYFSVIPESNMSSALTGDVSNSYRYEDLPVYNKTYTVYGQNIRRTQAETMHNRGHQSEALLSYACQQRDGNSDFFWNTFCGRTADGTFVAARAGCTHFPPNAAADYDYLNLQSVLSDCEDWTPANTGQKTQVNSQTWGSLGYAWPEPTTAVEQQVESQFYMYWMQNFPGRGNSIAYGAYGIANWWVFMADWDNALRSGLSLYGPRATGVATLPPAQFERLVDRSRLTAPLQPGCLHRLWRSADLASWYMPSHQVSTRGASTLTLDDLDPASPAAFYRLGTTVVVEP